MYKRQGPACGVQEDLTYRCLSTVLAPGEMLVGYTDGITEAVNPQNAQYGDCLLYTSGLAATGVIYLVATVRVLLFAPARPREETA